MIKFELGPNADGFVPGPLFDRLIAPNIPNDCTVFWIEFDGNFVKLGTSYGLYAFSVHGEAWGRQHSRD